MPPADLPDRSETATPSAAGPDAALDAARNHLAVALDVPTAAAALDLVDRLEGTASWLKVGLELYLGAGNALIETLHARGHRIFLDLKLHDIPNTVAGAIRSVASTGVSLLTVHAGGGEAMLTAAAEAAAAPGSPRLVAVTVLTSLDAQQLLGIGVTSSPAQQVMRLARLAEQCGITAMVSSAEEVAQLRAKLAPETLLVVPGIRPAGAAVGDQRRVATPATAIAAGASLLVVGRPITQAADPAAATRAILNEIAGSMTAV